MEPIAWEAILAAGIFFSLGATSPGPSLIVVLRNTLIGGRRQGVACAVGHGVGFGIYAGSAVFGLDLAVGKRAQCIPRSANHRRGALGMVWNHHVEG